MSVKSSRSFGSIPGASVLLTISVIISIIYYAVAFPSYITADLMGLYYASLYAFGLWVMYFMTIEVLNNIFDHNVANDILLLITVPALILLPPVIWAFGDGWSWANVASTFIANLPQLGQIIGLMIPVVALGTK